MDRAGIELVLQTHDEAVAEVDESTDASTVSQHMTVAPSWMPGIPLATEAVEGTHYAL